MEMILSGDGKTRSNTINLIRVLSCFLIVWNHISSHILNGVFNKILWANIGVQIFFFMSGYLYSDKEIQDKAGWLKKNIVKIIKPYWIYLAIIFPVIASIDIGRLSIMNVAAAFIGIQGFHSSFLIEGLGQHWFISYILLCYLLTPWILYKQKNRIGGGIFGCNSEWRLLRYKY